MPSTGRAAATNTLIAEASGQTIVPTRSSCDRVSNRTMAWATSRGIAARMPTDRLLNFSQI
jgi:hypothetical protein